MQQILMFGLLMAVFLALALAGLPVFFAMGLASLVFILFTGGAVPVNVLASSMVQGMDSFAFLAIPFFFLAGELMNTGGITRRLLAFASALVGHIRGGLSHVAILASMVFSGVSGSAVADASAIGSSVIPAMKEQGYPPAYAAAVVAAASTMGPIIPPSIAFVVYALVSEVSIGKLFLAGAVPGLLMAVYLLATAAWLARRRDFPYTERASMRRLLAAGRDALPALAMPFIILGGIVGGVTTPTEAGVAAVLYAILVGLFLYRELDWRGILKITRESMISSGMILLTIAASGIFSWLVANLAIGDTLAKTLLALTDSRWIMLVLINIALLLWGLALEPAVALVTLVPVLVPLANAYQIDLVHLGVIVVLNLMIGQLTPPSGVITFLTAQIAGAPLHQVFREALPFTLALIGVLLLVTFLPGLALWLPGVLIRG
ncbi:TRAP transporter large permease [Ramlibacter henchirensis]|uniref:TRAP transporter large permease protein n=1 Tax=Ramlibacter henchirensis TaxID=204072 RepID=A0A4Z0C2Z1_9BURK|nr:TRAP transporter large permease [Ramlibacter henchirensis]TFZ06027.1 TRAP transporter large permease [Ramlibacter henchirensis]